MLSPLLLHFSALFCSKIHKKCPCFCSISYILVFPFLLELTQLRFLLLICCHITFDRVTKDFHDDISNGRVLSS